MCLYLSLVFGGELLCSSAAPCWFRGRGRSQRLRRRQKGSLSYTRTMDIISLGFLQKLITFLLGLGGICGLEPDRSRASVDVSMVMGSSWISMDPVESALTLVRGTISSSLEGLVVSSCSLVVEARFRGFYRDKKINMMMVLSDEEVND